MKGIPVHLHEVETAPDDPLITIERFWEESTYVVDDSGDHIVSVMAPHRVALPFFVRDGKERQRAQALLDATHYVAEVHMVALSGKDRIAMFATPRDVHILLTIHASQEDS